MKKTSKGKSAKNTMKARLLSAGLAAATVFTLLAAIAAFAGCDNDTSSDAGIPETVQDFSVAGHPNIVIRGLPSLVQPYLDDFVDAIDAIYASYNDGYTRPEQFRNYVDAITTLTIVIEDVPEYTTGKNYRINPNDNSEFAMRYAFLATRPVLGVELIAAIDDMNTEFSIVYVDKQFNNAKETVRLAFVKATQAQG
jgi:hypothetical protein